MAVLIIVGAASIDQLHFAGRTERSIGGAGLYTALAAHRAGAQVTLFAPRPEPMPAELASVAERINWVGPVISPDELPALEIAHYGNGKAELVGARWGAERLLEPANLPAGGLRGEIAYCGPLSDPARQLAFIRHFHEQGYRTAVGTYGRAVTNYHDIVRQTLQEADIFFCNENEATKLFGGIETATTTPGKLLYITRSAEGCVVVQGEYRTPVPSMPVVELDPTGAGDTFCGTTLALLAQGVHPILAAQQATICAAEMVTAVGPATLLRPPPLPAIPADKHIKIDEAQ